MKYISISQKQFDFINKSLCEELGMELINLQIEDVVYVCEKSNYGGIGTLGYKYTEEQKRNISLSKKGKPSLFKGIKRKPTGPHKEDSKKKMSESCKNRPKTCCIICKREISGQSNFIQHLKFSH